MKASKLIEELESLMSAHGDIEVQLIEGGRFLNIVPVGQAYFNDSDNTIIIDE